MRQTRWLELLKDYDIDILYHPGKANVVPDALSQKSMGSLVHLEAYQRLLAKEVHRLASLGVRLADSNEGGEGIHKYKTMDFSLGMDDGSTKMYRDLKEVYWWNDMKRNVADFCGKMSKLSASEAQTPKARLVGTKHRDSIVEVGDDQHGLCEFAYNNNYHASIQMAPFEALYGRTCRSRIGLFEIGKVEFIGPDLVHQAIEKVNIIKERLKTALSRQKSHSDVRRKDLEFKDNDWVFLKVSPMKGITRFGKKGKLSPRDVFSAPSVSCIHVKEGVGDPSLIVPIETIEVNEELTYE
ncbi:uncharacterized protein [Nicotiana tomentosiformis]|uniref:uncharacterized protein n=1 Tax=Nicotiana tomentosiformis TaxID=4098 RepID=UPI00388C9B0B